MAKKALVVGVNAYHDEQIPGLAGAENDAREIRTILKEHGDFDATLLLSDFDKKLPPSDRATAENMRHNISELLWTTDPNEVTLFFFAGHGFKDYYGTSYLAPTDMIRNRPMVRGIDVNEIKKLAMSSKNKDSVILLLDCCYSGIAAKGERDVPPVLDTADLGLSDLGKSARGRIALCSSGFDQTSREKTNCVHERGNEEPHAHGVFTYQLIEGLRGSAYGGDTEYISLADLYLYVERQFRDIATQTPRSSFTSLTDLEGIIIARRPPEWRDLEEKLTRIQSQLDSGQYRELLFAAKLLGEFLSDSPRHQGALALATSVDEAMAGCIAGAQKWMTDKTLPLLNDGVAPALIAEIKNALANMTIENLAKLSLSFGLLWALMGVLDGTMQENTLVASMKGYSNKPSKGPSRRAGSGVALP